MDPINQLLVEQSPDAFIFAGTDGMIRLWNRRAEEVFGHSAAEAMGQSLDIIIPERLRDAHWRAYDVALESGETKYAGKALTTRSMRKDGGTIYVELTFSLVKEADGKILGALAIARDVTERYLADRKRKEQLKALQAASSSQ